MDYGIMHSFLCFEIHYEQSQVALQFQHFYWCHRLQYYYKYTFIFVGMTNFLKRPDELLV
jgi:hypothetical protein